MRIGKTSEANDSRCCFPCDACTSSRDRGGNFSTHGNTLSSREHTPCCHIPDTSLYPKL